MGTLADLVSGFQGGYTGVQDARRRRKLNQAIDYELGKSEEARIGRQAGRERLGYGGGYEGADFTMPQTYGERLVGYIKSKFGASTGQQNTTAIDPGMQPSMEMRGPTLQTYKDGGAVRNMKRYTDGGTVSGQVPGVMTAPGMGNYALPTPQRQLMSANVKQQAVPGFAEGGSVDEERMRRSYGDEYYVTEEEAAANRLRRSQGEPDLGTAGRYKPGPRGIPTSGGGMREFAGDVGRSVGNYFDDTRRAALEGREYMDIADAQLAEAEGAREVGRATRETGSAALTSAVGTTKGLLKDVFVDNPITQGALGFLGYGGEDSDPAEQAAVTQAVSPDAPVTPPTAAQPGATPPNTQTPQAKAAAQPAGPPDEIVDFSQVRDVMPEDLPNMGVKDWEDERRFWAANAISLGNDPFEAMKAVDARQMRGFAQYGQQAFQMLKNGDATGAARALYAAYQYFPNGSDVRFGVQKGVNGQPVLIGMGTDEETGEPLKEGQPTVITPESLSVQLENLSNPSAFRVWTKDWRAAEQEIREYNEVTKPAAESTARYQDRAGRAAMQRAQNDYNASVGAGGLKQTDRDRANAAFMDAVEMEGFTNPEQADAMMDMMTQIYQQYGPAVQYPTIIRDVRDAIRSGDMTALDQKYGR